MNLIGKGKEEKCFFFYDKKLNKKVYFEKSTFVTSVAQEILIWKFVYQSCK